MMVPTVREVASPDLGRMGFEIVSFVIVDIFDFVNYLDSLGKGITAQVKKEAAIGVAAAERDAGIKISAGQRISMEVKYDIESRIADLDRQYKLKQAQIDIEVSSKVAEAKMAYELQAAKLNQLIRKEEVQIDIVERSKQTMIEEKEVERVEKELKGTAQLPADALAFQLKTVAHGERNKEITLAQAYSERIRLLGGAEAFAIHAEGTAQAKRMHMKAEAYKKYQGAAVAQLVFDTLPKLAAEVSAPLEKVGEITILGGNRMDVKKDDLCSHHGRHYKKQKLDFLLDRALEDEESLIYFKSKVRARVKIKNGSSRASDFGPKNVDKG